MGIQSVTIFRCVASVARPSVRHSKKPLFVCNKRWGPKETWPTTTASWESDIIVTEAMTNKAGDRMIREHNRRHDQGGIGDNVKVLAELLNAKPREIKEFLRGQLAPGRTHELP